LECYGIICTKFRCGVGARGKGKWQRIVKKSKAKVNKKRRELNRLGCPSHAKGVRLIKQGWIDVFVILVRNKEMLYKVRSAKVKEATEKKKKRERQGELYAIMRKVRKKK